jgi:hypothetical protein
MKRLFTIAFALSATVWLAQGHASAEPVTAAQLRSSCADLLAFVATSNGRSTPQIFNGGFCNGVFTTILFELYNETRGPTDCYYIVHHNERRPKDTSRSEFVKCVLLASYQLFLTLNPVGSFSEMPTDWPRSA